MRTTVTNNSINKPVTNNSYLIGGEPKEFNVGFIPHKTGKYVIEIDDLIQETSQFSTAISVLEQANEDDEVEIKLQTPGGLVYAADALIHAMRKCKCPIHFVATGMVASAGTMLLLEADSFELSNSFVGMIHNGQAGAVGNLNEYFVKAKFDEEWSNRTYWNIYQGFLTREEFDGVMRGDNIYLTAEQWIERSQRRNEYYLQLAVELQQAQINATKPKRIRKKPQQATEDTEQ